MGQGPIIFRPKLAWRILLPAAAAAGLFALATEGFDPRATTGALSVLAMAVRAWTARITLTTTSIERSAWPRRSRVDLEDITGVSIGWLGFGTLPARVVTVEAGNRLLQFHVFAWGRWRDLVAALQDRLVEMPGSTWSRVPSRRG